MNQRLLCLLLVFCMVLSIAPIAIATDVPTEAQAYERIIALKEEYPEESPWTNDDFYVWDGGGCYASGGYGCVAFACMLSDAAFGSLPSRELTDITIEDVRVGDILRIKNNSHSVIVLEVHDSYVVIAEGNYLKTVHWGRKLSAEDVAKTDFMLTRYPENYTEPEETVPPTEETVPPTEETEPTVPELTGWRKAYYDLIQQGVEKEGDTDFIGWTASDYALLDINGDSYPELWVDHQIYANGCTLATITQNGLYEQRMQYGALSYLEGENIFLHSWGIGGYYADSVYSIGNEGFTLIAGGTGDTIEGVFTWNGIEMSEQDYIASMDTLVDPSKAMHGHDDPYTYEEFIALLYELEAVYGPEADIPTKPADPPVVIAGFTDVVPGSFYEQAVVWAVENEITTGRTETTFAPTDPCKRSEVVTFLHRAEGKPVPSTVQSEFTDVQVGKFYTDAVAWAVENEITNGMGDGTFGVSAGCTRAQVVTFLWRTAGCPAPTSEEHPFTDLNPDAFYYNAVLWAVENGITSGMSATTFAPDGTCTRAQIVTFLHRFAG